jgi:mRNA-degrading endonuclease toxin of MazEF toxin-antitoxin module
MAETRPRRTSREAFPRRGEIFLTALDPTVGHEIKKTRPALVIQNDITNRFGMTTIVAAITSRVSEPPYPNEVVIEPFNFRPSSCFHGSPGSNPDR